MTKNEIKIIDYEKKYKADIDKMELEQWNALYKDKETTICRVALVDNNFAGAAYGWMEGDYFYFDTICLLPKYQRKGIGTLLAVDMLNHIKGKCKGVKVDLLDNGKDGPRSRRIFENLILRL